MLGIEIGPNDVENIHNLPQAILRVDRVNQNGEEEGKNEENMTDFLFRKNEAQMNVIYGLDAKFGLEPSHLKWV
jgi:predicted fused transcriptional regulator/phosphomethylpyrimidine kinase